jgi:transcriptional regulator with XRE-family HTH domain
MKITPQLTDDTILTELGARLARVRLEKNLTQAQLALQAGVSKRTIERLEQGAAAPQLSSVIRLCRVLGLLENFELLLPEPAPSPMAQLYLRGKTRQRASRPRFGAVQEPPAPWTWGDSKP